MQEPEVLFPASGLSGISIAVTTRLGGVSKNPFSDFNLAGHVGDNAESVKANRQALYRQLQNADKRLEEAIWLEQVHGNEVFVVRGPVAEVPRADASVTNLTSVPLAILTADCLPIVLWGSESKRVAAIHAGWQGLANGLIERCLEHFAGETVCAFIGPGIGPCHYEVDDRVRGRFSADSVFVDNRPGHYLFDLAAEAQRQLGLLGVVSIQSMGVCTACDQRFYSYRRDGVTGRFATLIWRSA